MTKVIMEEVEIDLERFITSIEVMSRYLESTSLQIPTPASLKACAERLIAEQITKEVNQEGVSV